MGAEIDRDRKYCLYRHVSPSEKIYIGITSTKPEHRWGRNGNGYGYNRHFKGAIKKYGWDNFKHEILFRNLSKSEACNKEIELIRICQSNDPKFGYNVCGGGDGGSLFSEETRKKIGDKNKGRKMTEEFKRNLSLQNTGKKFSRERKKNISKSLIGRKLSSKHIESLVNSHIGLPSGHRKKVGQFSIDGSFIKEFDSATHASRALNCNHSSISGACSGYRKSCKGYKWKYSDGKGGWLDV